MTPPAVAAAMARFRAGEDGEPDVVEALRESRVLIPLIAELGETGQNAEGVTVDKSADLSIVTVAGPDGRTVLPVFTSMDAMKAWNAKARPVPTDFRAAAVAAVDERTDLVIVDPGSEGEFGMRRPAVWAVAKGSEWAPALTNTAVAKALAEGISREPHVRRIEIAPGCAPGRLEGAELRVSLVFETGCSQDVVRAAVGRVNERWSASPEVIELVDSLAVVLASEKVDDRAGDGVGNRTGAPSSEGTQGRPSGMRAWFSRRRKG
ncbi:SseB family protein [Pseudoclavibacter endophyticus]|uniref:SseB family protein n=2 Tax=Pseudoclavibacter endophyticus TaxID=1778590 RepID=A0A6H9WFR9_9MICO|nr:SseB family protein [Pseudoclavibacter endophyticus]